MYSVPVRRFVQPAHTPSPWVAARACPPPIAPPHQRINCRRTPEHSPHVAKGDHAPRTSGSAASSRSFEIPRSTDARQIPFILNQLCIVSPEPCPPNPFILNQLRIVSPEPRTSVLCPPNLEPNYVLCPPNLRT